MANILVVDDDRNIRRVLAASLESASHQVTVAENAERALELLGPSAPAVVVSDIRMEGMGGLKLLESIKRLNPAMPVVMMTAYGSIPDAVEAMRLGAYDYVTKPFTADHIVHVVARALEVHELRAENKELRDRIESLTEPEPFLTYSPHSRKLAETAAQVADSDATALITGESGTGKSMLASYIHRLSPRKDGPFVQVACTTLSEHLLESELFGHVRGSFTGAIKDKPGRLEAAEGGTVLLDEIGDLTPVVQSKLLRFLQERTFERVGGAQTIKVDARIIAATNQHLEQLVKEKRFREDLYYRLNVIELQVPALRDRPGEILKLAEHFAAQAAADASQACPFDRARGARGAGVLLVAGQHPRAAQRDGARGNSEPRRDDQLERSAGQDSRVTGQTRSQPYAGADGKKAYRGCARTGDDAGRSGRDARHQRRDIVAKAPAIRPGLDYKAPARP